MDPLTAGLNLLASMNALLKAIIDKAPPETVGEIITKHEQRISNLEAWLAKKFHFLDTGDGK